MTPREAEVMAYVASGYTNEELARRLSVSEKTAKELGRRAANKMGVPARGGGTNRRVLAARLWWAEEHLPSG